LKLPEGTQLHQPPPALLILAATMASARPIKASLAVTQGQQVRAST